MITVVLFLWKDQRSAWGTTYQYDINFVYRSINMVNRNLTLPHRFVLVTDAAKHETDQLTRIHGVDIVPVDESLYLPGKRFQKLMIWRPDAAELFGERILMMDLDLVIKRNIDRLIDRPEDVVLWGNPTPRVTTPYNTSMVLLTAGARPFVWTEFDIRHSPDAIARERRSGTDQAWVSRMLPPNEATWTGEDGFVSFRQHYLERNIIDDPDDLIVSFHGRISPSLSKLQDKYPWIKEHYR